MQEGWLKSDYLILFDDSEIAEASTRYAVGELLPGYDVLGLCGWDDFILRDSQGQIFSGPTVPLTPQHFTMFAMPSRSCSLQADSRFTGKIKWYIKPLVFGGDPNSAENLTWIDHRGHAELVRWWNNLYRQLKQGGQG